MHVMLNVQAKYCTKVMNSCEPFFKGLGSHKLALPKRMGCVILANRSQVLALPHSPSGLQSFLHAEPLSFTRKTPNIYGDR